MLNTYSVIMMTVYSRDRESLVLRSETT